MEKDGEQIIIMGDWNGKINNNSKWVKKLNEVGIREATQNKYLGELPATYNRGREGFSFW